MLFLLGYGWNLCLVGGSGVLTRQVPGAGATRAQGAVEATSWGTSTLATTASTLMFVHGGYPMLAIGAASLCILPLLALPLERGDDVRVPEVVTLEQQGLGSRPG